MMIRIFALLLLVSCGAPEPEHTPIVADSTEVAPREGPQVIHLPKGGRMEGTLSDGKRIGQWSSYFEDGTLRSRSEYVDGVEQGPTTVYHPNGKTMYTGQYLHGEPFGEWIYYGADGNEMKRVVHDSTGVVVR